MAGKDFSSPFVAGNIAPPILRSSNLSMTVDTNLFSVSNLVSRVSSGIIGVNSNPLLAFFQIIEDPRMNGLYWGVNPPDISPYGGSRIHVSRSWRQQGSRHLTSVINYHVHTHKPKQRPHENQPNSNIWTLSCLIHSSRANYNSCENRNFAHAQACSVLLTSPGGDADL
jgi:hypothetical protein